VPEIRKSQGQGSFIIALFEFTSVKNSSLCAGYVKRPTILLGSTEIVSIDDLDYKGQVLNG
jgi:hypothetical protein